MKKAQTQIYQGNQQPLSIFLRNTLVKLLFLFGFFSCLLLCHGIEPRTQHSHQTTHPIQSCNPYIPIQYPILNNHFERYSFVIIQYLAKTALYKSTNPWNQQRIFKKYINLPETGFLKKITLDTTTATLFIVFPTLNVTGEIP